MEALGSKSSRLSIVGSACLATLCLFYVYTVGTHFEVRTYPLIDRVTYYTNFDFYVVNEFVDHVVIGSLLILWLMLSIQSKIGRILTGVFAAIFIAAATTNYDPALDSIALAALPVIVSLIIYNLYSQKRILDSTSNLVLNYLAIIGIIIGVIGFAIAVYSIGFPNNESPLRNYTHEIFLLFSSFSPVLILLLITAFPLKLLIDFVRMRIKQLHPPPDSFDHKELSTQTKIIYLSLFVILSIAIASIPHLPEINKDNQLVGVDTRQYAIWINEMQGAADASDFINQVFVKHSGGDRPISLILIFAFQQMITAGNANESAHAIEYLPMILGPSLVFVVYFLTRELTADDKTSLFAAFLTAISFHVLIGVYAGFYANWMALIFGYLSFVFFFKFLKVQTIWNLSLFGILLTLTLFSHVYTWSIISLVIGIVLAVYMLKRDLINHNKTSFQITKNGLITLFIVLLCIVGIDIGRTLLTGSSGGIERDLQVSERAGLEQFVLRWNNLTYATTIYVGGLFANFIILGLGLYWLFTSKMKEKQNVFMIIFLSIGILPFLFGEWVIQTRVFYNIPFQIPAAFALSYIGRQSPATGLKKKPLYIWLVAVSVITISNFILLVPS